ncbi:MAG: transcriptional repressor [Candidatus Cloacimonetes bacterium]|jgi:Fur family ferric uptake transcriptional regulator|nr:transcriptional repressor [Candidatus Cloacimonadota bacterium]
MQDHEHKFAEYLAQKGLKLTAPRKYILLEAFKLHEHFNAEELYEKVKRVTPEVSLATVYRTLPLLMEAGLVQSALRSSGRDRYEHIYGHPKHIHWLCRSCGAIMETDLQPINETIAAQAKTIRFEAQDIELNIKGLCWKCTANDNENQPDES